MNFLEHRKTDPIVQFTELRDSLFGVEFLPEIIRRKPQNFETTSLVALVKGFQRLELRGKSAFTAPCSRPAAHCQRVHRTGALVRPHQWPDTVTQDWLTVRIISRLYREIRVIGCQQHAWAACQRKQQQALQPLATINHYSLNQTSIMKTGRPEALADNYYLANFHRLAGFVAETYRDILTPAERRWYGSLKGSSESAQRLYIRLLTRKGSVFRSEPHQLPGDRCAGDGGVRTVRQGTGGYAPARRSADLAGFLYQARAGFPVGTRWQMVAFTGRTDRRAAFPAG